MRKPPPFHKGGFIFLKLENQSQIIAINSFGRGNPYEYFKNCFYIKNYFPHNFPKKGNTKKKSK